MQMSKTIAALIGPTLMALGVALLVNLGSFPAIIESVSRDPALIFLSGVLLFVAGVAIVRVHNRWTSDWSVLVTALGCVPQPHLRRVPDTYSPVRQTGLTLDLLARPGPCALRHAFAAANEAYIDLS
jgi:hypothetical protein